eukprot:scaffold53_cov193-Pinguiococcus_pyrenoidosus.AAC.17
MASMAWISVSLSTTETPLGIVKRSARHSTLQVPSRKAGNARMPARIQSLLAPCIGVDESSALTSSAVSRGVRPARAEGVQVSEALLKQLGVAWSRKVGGTTKQRSFRGRSLGGKGKKGRGNGQNGPPGPPAALYRL